MLKSLPVLLLFATSFATAGRNPVCDLPTDNNGTASRPSASTSHTEKAVQERERGKHSLQAVKRTRRPQRRELGPEFQNQSGKNDTSTVAIVGEQ